MSEQNHFDDVADENIRRIQERKEMERKEIRRKLGPIQAGKRYSKYKKTRHGDYLVMENEEDGRYLIFNLDGSLAGSCDEGELQSALDNMLKAG